MNQIINFSFLPYSPSHQVNFEVWRSLSPSFLNLFFSIRYLLQKSRTPSKCNQFIFIIPKFFALFRPKSTSIFLLSLFFFHFQFLKTSSFSLIPPHSEPKYSPAIALNSLFAISFG